MLGDLVCSMAEKDEHGFYFFHIPLKTIFFILCEHTRNQSKWFKKR